MVAVPLCESYGFTGSITQIVELGPSGLAASNGLDIENIGRVQWKDSFDTLVSDHSPNGEGLVNATALAGNDCAGKYLRSLFLALFDTAVNLDDIAYLEVRDLALKTFALNGI